MRKFKVSEAGVGQRADVFVATKFPGFARSALSRLFDDGLVQVDGKVTKPSAKLQSGSQIQVDDTMLKAVPELIELPILYEDDDVLVMNKPAGILSHSKGALNIESTVASFLMTKITDKNLISNRAGIVHRLDRPTSGVMIGAKTEAAAKHLQKQFSNRKTHKTYRAIVEGIPSPAEAIIDAPIERNPKRPQTFRVASGGKSAQTRYKVLKVVEKNGKDYALMELRPITGRTHQLRVHLSYIGHPIVGDFVYGKEGPNLYLHAAELELTLPNSQRQVFKAPLPKYFETF